MIRRVLRWLAQSHGKAVPLYLKVCRPGGREWAHYLGRHGGFYRFGTDCSVLPAATFVDPGLTSIGDRACIGKCTMVCHDGAVEMLEQAYGIKLDRIGAIIIEDDVYIGEGAIIVGTDSVTIGAGSIIGAGAVVRSSIPAGSVVVGNPAKVVAKVENLVRFWEADFMTLPWRDLIVARHGAFDPAIEPELLRARQRHFFRERDEQA